MNQGWVYIQSERELWTVGHYRPNGDWQPESDHSTAAQAAARVHYLNGGKSATADPQIQPPVKPIELAA